MPSSATAPRASLGAITTAADWVSLPLLACLACLAFGYLMCPPGDPCYVLFFLAQNVRCLVVCCMFVTILSSSNVALAAPAPAMAPGTQVAALAQAYVGSRYAWGGASPAGFDCTGFVMWVFGQFDVPLPHNEAGQLGSGASVSPEDLQPGDVVVFANTYRRGLSHVGIYLGDGQFVHAVNESHGVMVDNLWDEYWGPRFVGASRPITGPSGR